ncbi:MAG: TolC family protein [Cyanobacteria bacterium J06559_3]
MAIALPNVSLLGLPAATRADTVIHQHTSNSKPLSRTSGEALQVSASSHPARQGHDALTATTPPSQAIGLDQLQYLEPAPNPLTIPTQPEEVAIVATQTITLSEALELAYRNNPELQIAFLDLEQSRAALQEAQANRLLTMAGFLQEQLTQF